MGVTLDDEVCYRALSARDARFDGRFFVAVETTGIYCRPVCRARTPRRDRCQFFARAAQAERAGFRACFRCRPERAPGHSSVDAVSALVSNAARRIEAGALNHESVDALAASLGVSARHLRRAMQSELGIGPLELAASRRVALARELLLGTGLPMPEVAFASGFASVRRFNAAYRESQGMTPSEVRRPNLESSNAVAGLRLVLEARPPFDATRAFDFLRARAVAESESFRGETYLRAVMIDGCVGRIAICEAPGKSGVMVEASAELARVLMSIAARTRRVFDTDADVTLIDEQLARDPLLAPSVRARPAVRVMGAFEPFEWAIRAVLGQQVSVRAARTLAGRLVARFGVPLPSHLTHDAPGGSGKMFAFPSATRLADARVEELSALGLTRARAQTVLTLSRAVAERAITLEPGADLASTHEALLELPGIGAWTAQYIEMRALGFPDAFPAGDLGLRKALGGLSTAACEARAERWRPFRAYAAARLWLGLPEKTP